MTNKEKIDALRAELKGNPKIEVQKFYTDEIPTEERLETKRKNIYNLYTKGEPTIVFSDRVKDMALSFNALKVIWQCENKISSTVDFLSLTQVLLEHIKGYWKDKIWVDEMDEDVKGNIQQCAVFDWFGGSSGQAACLRVKDNVITDEVWRYDMSFDEKVYPMGLNLQEYFDLMIECRGFQGWQDAYSFRDSDERQQFEEKFPLIFPDVDMEKLLAKFSKD